MRWPTAPPRSRTAPASWPPPRPRLSGGIAQARQGGAALQSQGTSVLVGGAAQLYGGLTQLADGSDTLAAGSTTLNAGAQSLLTGSNTLAAGTRSLADGSATLAAGTTTLSDGTRTLVGNNATLMSGANQLTDGARQIADGSDRLLSGSRELGDGLDELYDGADTLKSSLSDAADEVKATNTGDAAVDLFSAPVDTTEEQMTTVENNGHAMAPYMMSVALWVGCIAFSLMYPLTEYYGGKLKSGMAWWFSKASVLYLIAILQALCMMLCLHVFDGFNPANWGLTIAVAVAASLAFMSIMYFFTNFIGKAGSFPDAGVHGGSAGRQRGHLPAGAVRRLRQVPARMGALHLHREGLPQHDRRRRECGELHRIHADPVCGVQHPEHHGVPGPRPQRSRQASPPCMTGWMRITSPDSETKKSSQNIGFCGDFFACRA